MKERLTSSGSGAPPEVQNFRPEKSSFFARDDEAMTLKMAGTAGNKVGWCFLMDLSKSFSTNFGWRTTFAPIHTALFMAYVMANTWKNGSMPITTSLPGTTMLLNQLT